MRKLFILFVGLFVWASCSETKDLCEKEFTESEKVEISIERYEDQILGAESKSDLSKLILKEPIIANYFLQSGNYPNDSIMVNALYNRFSNPHIDTLKYEIDRVFENLEQLQNELNKAYSWLTYYYPETKLPKVKTVATGLENGADLYVSDTLIVIGLDYYLGEDAKYRPIGFPEYILKKYSQEYIVPSIMLLNGISPKVNASNMSDKTMLADMITYGKAYYFAKAMLPCTPDSVIIGYTKEEIEGSTANAPIIWAHFLDNELLYSSEHFLKQKYLGERPKTYDIGEKCPGRIGTWLGWAIVSQYAQRKETPLRELMNISNANMIFQESKFRPGK